MTCAARTPSSAKHLRSQGCAVRRASPGAAGYDASCDAPSARDSAACPASAGQGAEREHTAVVATLLQLLDQPLPGVIVAATNRIDMIDQAIRRRFDLELELPIPAQERLDEYALALFEKHRHGPIDWRSGVVATYSDVERLVTAAIRREVCR